MHIHAIRCRFGRLDGEFTLDPERLTLVIEDNERGKTTLTEAVLAALYGFPPRQREGDSLRERDRFLPLTGGPCFVELELTALGRRLRLRRDINGGGQDVVSITDRDQGADVTAELAPSKSERTPGEAFTGLNREQFLRVCLVRQGQVGDVRDGATLTQRIEALVDTSGGERTARAAVDALTLGLTKFQGEMVQTGKVDTEIDRLAKAAETARAERHRYEAERDRVDTGARRLGELEAEEAGETVAAQRLAYLAAAAELAALETERAGRSAREQRAATLQEQIAALSADRGAPIDGAARLEAALAALTDAQTALRARQDAMRAAEQETAAAQTHLAELGPAASWSAQDRDAILAAEQRLTHAEHATATTAASWERIYHNASEETRLRAQQDASPFARLTETDRRALLGYPSALAAAHQQAARRRSGPAAMLGGKRVPLLIAGAAFLLAGAGAAFVMLSLGIALAVIGVLLLAAGWFLAAPAHSEPATPSPVAEVEREGMRLAAMVEMATPTAAAEALGQYLVTHGAAIELRNAQQAHDSAQQAAAEARAALAGWWAAGGRPLAPEQIDAIATDELLRLADGVRACAEEVERRAARHAAAEEEAERAAATLRDARAGWRSLCRSLEVNRDDPPAAIATARARAERRQEHDRLEQELRALAPLAARTMRIDLSSGPDDQARITALTETVAALRAAYPELADLAPERDALSYQHELRALEARREQRQAERQQLLLDLAHVLDEVRHHLPQALQAEQEREQRLSAVRRYKDAVTLAQQTMEQVASEAHEAWAEELNAGATAALGPLAPGYPEARFSKRLELQLIDAGGRAWSAAEVQGRLSNGVRDRIYLAVRLALAGYCSPEGDPLPLILDDPFATSDDERSADGLRFLLDEIVPRHQVVLLSCHRARHDALRAANPALWAERVHLLTLAETPATG